MFDVGRHLKGQLLSVSLLEYNPRVEDWVTGRLTVTLFYNLVLGLSQKA